MKILEKIFAVYKPQGPTSFDVVRRVKEITGAKKVGHAGTLDPMAEGVLVIAVGDATKKIAEVVAKEKEYEAVIKLGETSTTDDEEGEKHEVRVEEDARLEEIKDILKNFIGKIMQVPPVYSAVKVRGKEAYKYARKAQSITLKAREVLVKNIELIRYKWPLLELRITTGPGVYIRALARDIGAALKTGGYMAALKRTRVGDFMIADAVPYDTIPEWWEKSQNRIKHP